MRRTIVVTLVTAGLGIPAIAEQRSIQLPEIVIGGDAPGGGRSENCVEVEIGNSRAYNCLNQKLKKEVDRVNPSVNMPPVDARSPDIRVGVVNIPAVQQQYGKNFGVSVMPYRPALPTFSPPLGRR